MWIISENSATKEELEASMATENKPITVKKKQKPKCPLSHHIFYFLFSKLEFKVRNAFKKDEDDTENTRDYRSVNYLTDDVMRKNGEFI